MMPFYYGGTQSRKIISRQNVKERGSTRGEKRGRGRGRCALMYPACVHVCSCVGKPHKQKRIHTCTSHGYGVTTRETSTERRMQTRADTSTWRGHQERDEGERPNGCSPCGDRGSDYHCLCSSLPASVLIRARSLMRYRSPLSPPLDLSPCFTEVDHGQPRTPACRPLVQAAALCRGWRLGCGYPSSG